MFAGRLEHQIGSAIGSKKQQKADESNPKGRLRCEVPVRVRFTEALAPEASD